MSGRSYWRWTLVISADGYIHTIPGTSDAPIEATQESILPGILRDLPRHLKGSGGRYRVTNFTATRIA